MHENEAKEKERSKTMLDSYTIGTPAKDGALKVYFDIEDLKTTQKKVENLLKLRKMINSLL